MTPAPPAAQRLPLLTCLLALVAGLALASCGDDGAAKAEDTTAAHAEHRAETEAEAEATPGRPCPAKLDAFAGSLERLRRQLAIGLSYEQYAAKVKALRAAYGEIPVGRLAIGCLATTGTASERAFNKYIDAANAWGQCLADAACTTATIEPTLQRKWRIASRFLSAAR
jgi:hypothetical protein